MLSPHTPPGTKVVCINAQGVEPVLIERHVYTVRQILAPKRAAWMVGGEMHTGVLHGVELEEAAALHGWGFHPRRFRRAELPSCLTELLNTETV